MTDFLDPDIVSAARSVLTDERHGELTDDEILAALAQFKAAIERYESLHTTLGSIGETGAGSGVDELLAGGVSPSTNVFAPDGEVWTISYQGEAIRLRDAKGLHDLRTLLLNPGQPIHVTELVGVGARSLGADPVLDEKAKRAYRARLADLDDDIDEAERRCDPVRAEQARAERDIIIDQLASAVGFGGRDRRLGDEVERARKTVWARIRHAVDRIAGHHGPLGHHLADSVSTGTFCSYQPGDAAPWR